MMVQEISGRIQNLVQVGIPIKPDAAKKLCLILFTSLWRNASVLFSDFHLCIKLVKFREGSINQSKQPEAQCNEPTGCQAAAVMTMMMAMVMEMVMANKG